MPELVASTPIRMKNGMSERLKSAITRMGDVVRRLRAGFMPRTAPKPKTPTRPIGTASKKPMSG